MEQENSAGRRRNFRLNGRATAGFEGMRQFMRLAYTRAEFTALGLTASKPWQGVHSARQRKSLRASPYEAPSRQGDPDRIARLHAKRSCWPTRSRAFSPIF